MKYQDFFSDENFISSEDTIFIIHMWRYQGHHDFFSLSQCEIAITMSYFFWKIFLCILKENNIT